MMRTARERDDLSDTATDWLVRTQSDALTANDWSELTRWLEASPDHLEAYEAIEQLDSELGVSTKAILDGLSRPAGKVLAFRPRSSPPRPRTNRRAAIAAGFAVAAIGVGFAGWRASEGPLTVYATGPGASRAIVLADGTHISLDANSKLSVRLGWFARRAKLEEAVASFDVAKDPKRPFIITADDERVRVVGTEFVVRDYAGVVGVTVRRGVVSVSPANGGGEARLTTGWTLRHVVNSDRTETRRVDPDAAFAWTQGRVVADRQPVADVIAYLNHRYSKPIRLAPGVASRQTFSGVLDLGGDEDDVVRRLAAYVSLAVHRSATEIVLS